MLVVSALLLVGFWMIFVVSCVLGVVARFGSGVWQLMYVGCLVLLLAYCTLCNNWRCLLFVDCSLLYSRFSIC